MKAKALPMCVAVLRLDCVQHRCGGGGGQGRQGGQCVRLSSGERPGSTPDATRKSGEPGGDRGQQMENDQESMAILGN